MSDKTKLDEEAIRALKEIMLNRSQIIEEFIEFWLAVHIPKEYLTLHLLENITLVEAKEGSQTRYWVEFMDPKDRPGRKDVEN